MKNRVIFAAIVLIGFATIFGACKKYEDGPTISLRSKKNRVAGEWVLEAYYVNDVLQPITGDQEVVEMKKDGTGTYTWGSIVENFTWEFGEGKETIRTKDDDDTEWDEETILRLKEKELWTKETTGSIVTETHWKKK